MNFQDCQIMKVDRNKFNEMVVRFKVKPEDYTPQEYEDLRYIWQEGMTKDIEIEDARASKEPENFNPNL